MSDKAKAAGGAAVGAGGILALILKSGSAEVHAVEGVGQVGRLARVGEESALVGRGASASERGLVGVGAGYAGAGVHAGEVGALRDVESCAAVAASDTKLTPFSHVADDGTKTATQLKPGTIVGKNGKPDRIAAARYRLKDWLAKHPASAAGEHELDAKDLLDYAMDAYDLAPDDDGEDEVEQRFKTAGYDFQGELRPSAKHAPLDGLDGATRTLLTDGRALVPAVHLASTTTLRPMDQGARQALGRELLLGTPSNAAVYVEEPMPIALPPRTSATSMVLSLATSTAVVWEQVATTKPLALPRVLETDRARYDALARPTPGASRVVVIHAASAP